MRRSVLVLLSCFAPLAETTMRQAIPIKRPVL